MGPQLIASFRRKNFLFFNPSVIVLFTCLEDWMNSDEAKEKRLALQGQKEAAAESSKVKEEEKKVAKGDPEMVPLYLRK